MNLIVARRTIASAALFASVLMAACGQRSTNSSSETLTVYEDKPTLKLLDLGPPGNSPGGVYHFFARLKMATDANPNLETPATVLFFTFADHQDQIVALGAFDYPATAGEFEAGQPVVRAIMVSTLAHAAN